MKTLFGTLFCLLLMISCNRTEQGGIAYRISEKDLIPEGITYSANTNSFYISSIYKTKIIKIDAKTGAFNDFIPSDLLGMRFLGMITDESRNHLWACGNSTKNGKSQSTVSKFNLANGELLKTYSYPDTIAKLYNDLVQDETGHIYFTDSDGQTIYKIDIHDNSISIFYDGIEIPHPNGITISADGKYLYIATNTGIRVLEITTRKIMNEADSSMNSKGLDGLKYYKNSLIGIQNGVQRSEVKIAQYFLDESGTQITGTKIIDQNNPNFNIPTTFVLVNNQLFCLANSQLANYSEDRKIISFEALDDVLILKYDLE